MELTPRRRLALACAACLAVGAAAGYFARPAPEVEERLSSHMQATTESASHEEAQARREAEVQATTDTHQVRQEDHGRVVTTWHPDGRVVREQEPVHVREETSTRAAEQTRETASEDRRREESSRETVVQVVEVEKLVRIPDFKWALGPAVGFSARSGPLAGAHLTTPPLGPFQFSALMVGGQGEVAGFVTGQLRF